MGAARLAWMVLLASCAPPAARATHAGPVEDLPAERGIPAGPLVVAAAGPSLPPGSIVDIGVGAARVCALHGDGRASCFSAGRADQIPEELPFAGIRRLVLGESATCGLLVDGTVKCDGVSLPELGEVSDLALGRDQHCALAPSGALRCWEANHPDTVRRVSIEGEVVEIDSAFSHVCAVTSVGEVHCWGDNGSGQLGVPSPEKSASPVRVPGIGRIVEVATGGDHTCAREASGRVWCWGAGHYAQAGDGTADTREPPTVGPDVNARSLVAGAHHSCAIDPRGSVVCWGWNLHRQMGEDRSDRRAPTPIAGLPPAGHIGAHGAVTCALAQGRVLCLGGYSPGHFGPWRFAPEARPR